MSSYTYRHAGQYVLPDNMSTMGRRALPSRIPPVLVDGSLPTIATRYGRVRMGQRRQLGGIDVVFQPHQRRVVKALSPAAGLLMGQTTVEEDVTVRERVRIPTAWTIAALIASGVLSYYAGKALAPTKAKQKRWGWIGVPVGMFTGPVGLGVMGISSLNKRS